MTTMVGEVRNGRIVLDRLLRELNGQRVTVTIEPMPTPEQRRTASDALDAAMRRGLPVPIGAYPTRQALHSEREERYVPGVR
ncbi:MAG: hypothetical protein NT029_07495 [Armatimonadetes bacterium]|nr:hypothetical protein [Armatimonadota bacterium]